MKWFKRVLLLISLFLGLALAQGRESLVIAGRDGIFGEAMELAVTLFEAENPQVDIELLKLPHAGLYGRLVISLRERTAAFDIVMLDDIWATEFMASGWLRNLDEVGVAASPDFIDSTVRVSRYPYGEGALFALPHVGNVLLFAYRSDLFKQHGLARPESWSAVLEAARALDGQAGGVDGVVFRGVKGNPIVTGFLPILWAFGGDIVDAQGRAAFASPEAVAALELFLALKDYAPEGVVTYNSSEVRDALQRGNVAMAIEVWPGWIPALDNPEVSQVVGLVEIAPPPGEVAGSTPMLGSWLLGVAADAPNPDRAVEFLKFVTSAEVQKRLALEVGLPPTRESVYTDPEVIAAYRWYPAQLAALQDARPRPRVAQWSEVETILGDFLQLALIGQLSPEQAVAEAQRRLEAVLR